MRAPRWWNSAGTFRRPPAPRPRCWCSAKPASARKWWRSSFTRRAPRVGRPFVAVNCSGIPETLLESELFGHVRGSFTGAYRDKPGLVRQADHGTLFLDELGEMSLRMQAVLLRFAETGEIQPIGSDAVTGRTDVRLITATNRDLRKQIEGGQFREDLYYRLNVIQIAVPPLRQRGDDVCCCCVTTCSAPARRTGCRSRS